MIDLNYWLELFDNMSELDTLGEMLNHLESGRQNPKVVIRKEFVYLEGVTHCLEFVGAGDRNASMSALRTLIEQLKLEKAANAPKEPTTQQCKKSISDMTQEEINIELDAAIQNAKLHGTVNTNDEDDYDEDSKPRQ